MGIYLHVCKHCGVCIGGDSDHICVELVKSLKAKLAAVTEERDAYLKAAESAEARVGYAELEDKIVAQAEENEKLEARSDRLFEHAKELTSRGVRNMQRLAESRIQAIEECIAALEKWPYRYASSIGILRDLRDAKAEEPGA